MFTTMCPKEQQTSDNLIVNDNCFIIEIFDKGNGHLENSYKNYSQCFKFRAIVYLFGRGIS